MGPTDPDADESCELDMLRDRWMAGDRDSGAALVGRYAALARHMVHQDRSNAPAEVVEDLLAESTVVLLEYFRSGGDTAAPKVAAVLRGRLRSARERPVRLTEGEEVVVRVIAGVRAESGTTPGRGVPLRTEVERRCEQWALDRCDGDAEAARRKLVQRGVARALRDVEGLLSVTDVVHLDAPLPSGDGTVGDNVAATAPGLDVDGDAPDVLADLLHPLSDPERRAVLWVCGIDGDPASPRTEVETACGLAPRTVHRLLSRLAWRAASPHTSFAMWSPALTSQVEHVDDDRVAELFGLASRRPGCLPS